MDRRTAIGAWLLIAGACALIVGLLDAARDAEHEAVAKAKAQAAAAAQAEEGSR